jgi:hypothetical protein
MFVFGFIFGFIAAEELKLKWSLVKFLSPGGRGSVSREKQLFETSDAESG